MKERDEEFKVTLNYIASFKASLGVHETLVERKEERRVGGREVGKEGEREAGKE